MRPSLECCKQRVQCVQGSGGEQALGCVGKVGRRELWKRGNRK